MFFLKSLIYPVFSPSFYVEAVKKGIKKAFVVYTLFTILISIFGAIYFGATFGYKLLKLPDTLGDMPEISLDASGLSINPEKPYIFSEEATYFAIDTTGSITEIPAEYSEGFLLLEDRVLIRSKDTPQDQSLTYDQLLQGFGKDSFYIDSDVISGWVQSFGVVIIVASPIFMFIGNFISRLFTILMIAILGLIALSAMDQKDAFRKSFLLAMYASIPVFYLDVLLGLIGKGSEAIGINFSVGSICCLIPIMFSLVKWGFFWGLGAYGLKKADSSGDEPVQKKREHEKETDTDKKDATEDKEKSSSEEQTS